MTLETTQAADQSATRTTGATPPSRSGPQPAPHTALRAGRRSRRVGTRSAVRGPRMLAPLSARPAPVADPGVGRPTLRLPVPDRLLRMTRAGLARLSSEPAGWWRRVEGEMGQFVAAHVPPAAQDVRLTLDVERTEIVIEYTLPFPS